MIKMSSVVTLIVLLLGAPSAWAQDSREVAKLKARLDKLEAENAAIKKELAELKKTLAALQGSPHKLPQATEANLKKAVDDFFEDLNNGRQRSAYASMSRPYQKRTERSAFDAFTEKHKSLLLKAMRSPPRRPDPPRGIFDMGREYKFRKLDKDYAYECDIVIPDKGGPSSMTVRLIGEEGAWKIDDFVELKERKKE